MPFKHHGNNLEKAKIRMHECVNTLLVTSTLKQPGASPLYDFYWYLQLLYIMKLTWEIQQQNI